MAMTVAPAMLLVSWQTSSFNPMACASCQLHAEALLQMAVLNRKSATYNFLHIH